MSLRTPTWDEFAWSAFLYGAIGGDKSYQELMNKTVFLNDLRNNPQNLTIQNIRKELITGFLNRWKCRVINSNQSASSIKNQLINLLPFLHNLNGLDITTCDFNKIFNIQQKNYTAQQIIYCLYKGYRNLGYRFGPTATSKLLHVLQPDLFVMWDGEIIKYYKRLKIGVSSSYQGYFNYLLEMQNIAQQISLNFNQASLTPKKLPNQSLENYLSVNMGYSPTKSIAKYIDEYNWVTITNNVKVPPNWHP